MAIKKSLVTAMLAALLVAGVFAAVMRHAGSERDYPAANSSAAASSAATEPAPVNGSQPRWVPIQLELAGEVLGTQAAAVNPLTVVVNVGGRSFPATVLGTGYRATINALSPDDMVVVEATAPKVHYRSVLGSFGNVGLHSHGDRKVDQTELPALRVSPLSTAVSWMVNRALAGRDAASDGEFERASRAVASFRGNAVVTDLTTIAFVLETIAVGDGPVPGGHGDGYALLRDQAAYRDHIAAPGVTAGASDYPFRGSDYAPLRSLAELPANLLLSSAWSLGETPLVGRDVQILVKDAADSYSLYQNRRASIVFGEVSQPVVEPAYRPSLTAAGELALEAINPQAVEVQDYAPFSPNAPVRILRTVQSRLFRRLYVGDRVSLWASRTVHGERYPDHPDQPARSVHEVQVWSVSDLDRASRAGAWAGLQGRRALPWFCMQSVPDTGTASLNTCEYVQHRFDPGGTGMTEDAGFKVDARMQPQPGAWGGAFTWSADAAGRLQVTSSEARVQYWNIDAGDAATDVVVYLARNTAGTPAGQTVAGTSLAISGDSVPLAASQVVGTWTVGATLSPMLQYPDPLYRLDLKRMADGTGQDVSTGNGISDPVIPSNWQVAGERIFDTRYMARYSTGGGRYVQGCAAAFAEGATGCSPRRVRYFRPLMRVGSRLYGIEDFYFQVATYAPPGYTGTYTVTRLDSRPYFHQCTEGACLTAFPASSPSMPLDGLDSVAPAPIPVRRRLFRQTDHADLRFRMQ